MRSMVTCELTCRHLFFVSLFTFVIYFEVLSNVDMWVEVTCELTFKCLVSISCHTIVLWLELSSKKAWHAWCHYFIRPFLVYEWICGFGRGLTLALHPSWMRHGWWHYTGICNWPNTKFNYSNRHKRWKRWESPIVWVQRFLRTIAIMGPTPHKIQGVNWIEAICRCQAMDSYFNCRC